MNSVFDGLLWSEVNARTLIPATILMALFAYALRRLLNGKSDRVRNLPFVVLALALLVLEVIKQVRELQNGFSAYALPFHFSSVYLFLYPLAHFTKGKFAHTMKSAAAAMTAMSAQGTMLFPMTVFGDCAASYFENFGAFHTITYHYALILYLFLFIAIGDHRPVWRRDAPILAIAVTAFSLVAAPAANLFQANYTSFLYSVFTPLENLRLGLVANFGVGVAQTLYALVMYVAILITGMFALGTWNVLDKLAFAVKIRTVFKNAFIFAKRSPIDADAYLGYVADLHLTPEGFGGMRAAVSERQLI